MASEAERISGFQQSELSNELAGQWRRLTHAATAVALITVPAVVVWLNQTEGWSWFWSILAALFVVICLAHKLVTTRYHGNPYELEARRAVDETQSQISQV